VEIEKLTNDDANPEEVREELFNELESLGLSREDEETRGYDTQIYQLRLDK
jgi:adenylate cyclase class IV